MRFKIIALASVITICSGEPPVHPTNDDLSSNHAVSSQSFVREDVPLSYKYSSVHVYTTVKPQIKNSEKTEHYSSDRVRPHPLQYAPIPISKKEQDSKRYFQHDHVYREHPLFTKAEAPPSFERDNQENEGTEYSIAGVEEQVPSKANEEKQQEEKRFAPGHNIELRPYIPRQHYATAQIYETMPTYGQPKEIQVNYPRYFYHKIQLQQKAEEPKSQLIVPAHYMPTLNTRVNPNLNVFGPQPFPKKTVEMSYASLLPQLQFKSPHQNTFPQSEKSLVNQRAPNAWHFIRSPLHTQAYFKSNDGINPEDRAPISLMIPQTSIDQYPFKNRAIYSE